MRASESTITRDREDGASASLQWEPFESSLLLWKWSQLDLIRQFDNLRIVAHDLDAAEVNSAVARLYPWQQACIVDGLVAAGATIDVEELYRSLDVRERASNVDRFLAAGANVDLAALYAELPAAERLIYFASFVSAGLPFNADEFATVRASARADVLVLDACLELHAAGHELGLQPLVDSLDPADLGYRLDLIREVGLMVDVQRVVAASDDFGLAANAGQLHRAGASINFEGVVERIARQTPKFLSFATPGLLQAGVSPRQLIEILDFEGIAANLAELLAVGADIDVDVLVQSLSPAKVRSYYLSLRAAGARPSDLQRRANTGGRGGPTGEAVTAASRSNPSR